MIAGPPGLFLVALLFIDKEGIMLAVSPDLDVHFADRTTLSRPFHRLNSNSFSTPTSPKMRELRARYEALQTTKEILQAVKSRS
jgi:hypothetical protein